MHKVLVNRLGGLSLPRKSVVRLSDRPDMTNYLSRVLDFFFHDIISLSLSVSLSVSVSLSLSLTSAVNLCLASFFLSLSSARLCLSVFSLSVSLSVCLSLSLSLCYSRCINY